MLCWSRKCLERILTAEHPLSKASKVLQSGVTWFSPKWKAAFFQGPMGLLPASLGIQRCFGGETGVNILQTSGISFILNDKRERQGGSSCSLQAGGAVLQNKTAVPIKAKSYKEI